MPSGLIDDQDRMSASGDLSTDQFQMFVHSVSIGPRHDQSSAFPFGGADGAKDVRPLGALIVRRAKAGPALRPSPGDPVLLPHPGFVLEPDLYRRSAVLDADGRDHVGEAFLNASIASGSCA